MDSEVRGLQEDLRKMEEVAGESLGSVRESSLDLAIEDGRTLRQVIYDLTDHYREHIEQLLWSKWGQKIGRTEIRRALAELQSVRSQFAAYFTDLQDAQLDVSSASAQDSSPREIILHALEEEDRVMKAIDKVLGE
ncbi:MAG: hypothetical protein QF714_03235 [Dehalococcoidia bacterium]|jgi:hypothetical protein|nr:hypothetical protein [Dehalococcoidia bacterium]MDP6226706.1 hypothetical protein [Dehalococcoidia bacterium]MDP7083413.1 hypothetical protein [Dehalococcoidia bacterium]MDP7200284.1 hypothetical protein [Dehalococcoidia bacterium]MDP7511182.1 hypothetical protein [Dehalococcoidia bacterium]